MELSLNISEELTLLILNQNPNSIGIIFVKDIIAGVVREFMGWGDSPQFCERRLVIRNRGETDKKGRDGYESARKRTPNNVENGGDWGWKFDLYFKYTHKCNLWIISQAQESLDH